MIHHHIDLRDRDLAVLKLLNLCDLPLEKRKLKGVSLLNEVKVKG